MKRAPAFSLIELLVVIAIIALVIAIIVPALGGARTAAKKAGTSQLLTQVTDAAMQFSQDNDGRMPGYFLPGEMGDSRNIDSSGGGFTTMENVLLSLAGQNAIVDSGEGQLVGPFGGDANEDVWIDFDLLGTGNNVYLQKVKDYLQVASGQVGSDAHKELPDLVDAFGNPLLAWVEDPTGPREPATLAEFATDDSSGDRARSYWASNFGWLTSTSLGKGGKDQNLTGGTGSLLADRTQAEDALTAVLGNPNFPIPVNYQANSVRPKSSRGAFVVHSAGADGVFFGAKDPGARALGVDGSTRPLEYRFNFFDSAGNRLKDSTGKIQSIDVTKGFDDIMSSGGN
jgi:prepilin-type N-terminal cleavage/methylation domain-containing protein